MNIIVRVITSLVLLQMVYSQGNLTNANCVEGDSLIVRLSPKVFRILPSNIIQYLMSKKYTIPQSWVDSLPHNIISGSFLGSSEINWSVLASKNGQSRIIVFPNDTNQSPFELNIESDIVFLQGMGRSKMEYSRYISVAKKEFILKHNDTENEPGIQIIDHDGIDDSFAGKASGVFYFSNGKWIELYGSD